MSGKGGCLLRHDQARGGRGGEGRGRVEGRRGTMQIQMRGGLFARLTLQTRISPRLLGMLLFYPLQMVGLVPRSRFHWRADSCGRPSKCFGEGTLCSRSPGPRSMWSSSEVAVLAHSATSPEPVRLPISPPQLPRAPRSWLVGLIRALAELMCQLKHCSIIIMCEPTHKGPAQKCFN